MKKTNLKNIKKSLILCLILIIFMFNINVVFAQDSVSEILIEQTSGRILYGKNYTKKRGIASTTKIATCITVLDNFDITSVITIKQEWTGIEGSSVYLKEGEKLTVKDLLYCLMLRSGNDSAVSLACGLAGSEKKFCELMNKTAKQVGALNTNFVNPHGLDDSQHYSTAYDLALITRYAMNNPTFCEIVKTKCVTVGSGDSKRVLINKNKLLSSYENATGVKTGYTKKCGRCLVSSSEKEGFSLISVVLNCGPMYERSRELFEMGYSEYDLVKLTDKEKSVGEVVMSNGESAPCYVNKNLYYPLNKEEQKDINYKIFPYEKELIKAKFAQECGTIQIFIKKQLLFTEKIYTILDE